MSESLPVPAEPDYCEQMRLTLIGQVHELIDIAERHAWTKDPEEKLRTEGVIAYARKVTAPYNYNGRAAPVPQVAPIASGDVLRQALEAMTRLQEAYNAATPGKWRKGRTTHHTAADLPNGTKNYTIGEFHHADDAHFCDVAHETAPVLLEFLRSALQAAPSVQSVQRVVPSDELLNKLINLGAKAAAHNAKANSDDGHAGTEAQGAFYEVRNEMRALLAASHPSPAPQERSAKDYAIEHAEYMAVAAEELIDAMQAEDVEATGQERETTPEWDNATMARSEATSTLRSRIYEFRKRRDRAIAAKEQQAGDVAANPGGALPDTLGYATRIAESTWRKHYQLDAPDWEPYPDLMGVLTQIDNMLTGLGRVACDEQPPPSIPRSEFTGEQLRAAYEVCTASVRTAKRDEGPVIPDSPADANPFDVPGTDGGKQ